MYTKSSQNITTISQSI